MEFNSGFKGLKYKHFCTLFIFLMCGFIIVCLPVLSKSCQKPYFNSRTLLPDILVGNHKFFLKSVNGCYACSKYLVLIFRQVLCNTSINVLVFELLTFLFLRFGAYLLRFTSVREVYPHNLYFHFSGTQ